MDSFDRKLDGQIKIVCDLKANLHYSQKDIDKLRLQSNNSSLKCKEMTKVINDLGSSIKNMTEHVDCIDNQTGKMYLVFVVVPETHNEKLSESEDKIKKIISEKIKLDTKHRIRTGVSLWKATWT